MKMTLAQSDVERIIKKYIDEKMGGKVTDIKLRAVGVDRKSYTIELTMPAL